MHPLFISNRSFFSLSILWALLCVVLAFILLQLAQAGGELIHWFTASVQLLPWYYLLLFFSISNLYLCRRLSLDQTDILVLIVAHGLAALTTVGLWLLSGWGWTILLDIIGLQNVHLLYSPLLLYHTLIGVLVYGVWLMVHYSFLTAAGDKVQNAKVLEQQLLISSIELQALRATVHPHFMYNSLNMLANLSLSEPEKIHGICVKMSDFLRYSVSYGKKPIVTLGDEIGHIKNYLAIEQERFGDKLRVNYQTDAIDLEIPTLPLVLFPLVENAIKHGIQSQLDGGYIDIALTEGRDSIRLEVINSFDPLGIKSQGTGHGLSTLRKRLTANYGVAVLFTTNKADTTFSVTIQLPKLPPALRLEAMQ